jgi:hypothetical protein
MEDLLRRTRAEASGRARLAASVVLAVGALLAVSQAGGAQPGQHRSPTATPTFVRFVFKSAHTGLPLLEVRGNGRLKLAQAPTVTVFEPALYVNSTVVVTRHGSSATFEVFAAKYRFLWYQRRLYQQVILTGHITRSTIRACRVGSSRENTIEIRELEFSELNTRIAVQICGTESRTTRDQGAIVRIVPTPRPALLPSELTLTVNGESCTAHVRKNCYRPGNGGDSVKVPSLEPLTIKAEANERMPKGWLLQVYRTSDPLSPGNGVYYLVCKTTTAASCEAIRPGLSARDGDIGDLVYAQVAYPPGTWLYAQINLVFKKP